jgi:hypothetical protein
LFVALLAATLWLLRARESAPPAPFFTLKKRLPDTVTVAYAGDTTVVVPGGEGWEVVRPVRYPADAVLVEALVERLDSLEVAEVYPLPPQKMDTYGFRIPRGLVRAAYEDGHPPDTLWIGGFTLDGAYDYVRAGTGPQAGILESRITRGFLLKGTDEIRDTRLLPFHESQATGFRLLEGGRVRLAAQRSADGSWSLLAPYPGPAEVRKVREYLTSAAHMHVQSFLREGEGPRAPFGLDPPRRGIQVDTEAGKRVGVGLGAPVPGSDLVYAVTEARPHLFGVSVKYVPFLAEPADAFRRRAVVDFGLADVDSVRVEGAGRGWGSAIDRLDGNARELLGRWALLHAVRFAPAAPETLRRYGLQPPGMRLRWLSRGALRAEMAIGFTQGGDQALYVRAGDQARPSEVLFVPETEIAPLREGLRSPPGPSSARP